MNYLRKKLKRKNGSVALEATIAGGALLMVFILIIGYFTYLYPRYMVDLEVQSLAHSVKMDGKLTESDKQIFMQNMLNRGYESSEVQITVLANEVKPTPENDPSKTQLDAQLAVTGESVDEGVNGEHTRMVERNNGQIYIRVEVPANDSFLSGGLNFFNTELKDSLKTYTVERYIASEAYASRVNGGG